MVCSLFACRLSASEAFLFLSGVVCWVFSNAYTKEEHLLGFFRGRWSEKGRSYSTQKATRRLRHSAEALVEEAKVKVFRPPQRTCLTQNLHLRARRNFPWLSGAFCSQTQPRVLRKWAMASYAKDLWGLWQDVTQDWRPSAWLKLGKNNDYLEIDLTSWQQTYSWIWNVELSWGRFALFEATQSLAHLSTAWSACIPWAAQITPPPKKKNSFKISRYGFRVTSVLKGLI